MPYLSEQRKEIQMVLEQTGTTAVQVRRSDREDSLFAVPLGFRYKELIPEFVHSMGKRNWQVRVEGNWCYLDKQMMFPESETAAAAGEKGALLSLLSRHRHGKEAPAAIRALLKADERGEEALEDLCRQWHMICAEKLRKKEELPDLFACLSEIVRRRDA